MLKIGFIDYYLDEWHANNYPAGIREASEGEMEVIHAYGMIPNPITGMTTEEWCKKNGVIRCDTIEELVDKSDRLIILSPDNSEMHETLCQIPLRSGKPCYIDKTFAPDIETAQRIFNLADKYNTPCFSTSALRYASEYNEIDTNGITAICSWGKGVCKNYLIHQLEPLMMLMGIPAQKVMMHLVDNWYCLMIAFIDGRMASVSGYREGSPFMMNICRKNDNHIIRVESDYYHAFVQELVAFFESGIVPVSHDETLSIMAVWDVIFQAMKCSGEWVDVYRL